MVLMKLSLSTLAFIASSESTAMMSTAFSIILGMQVPQYWQRSFLCCSEVIVVGQTCNYEGQVPDKSKVSKICNWPPCQTKTEVRGFLGTVGTIHIWIKDFSVISHPLVHLTKKDVPFDWGEKEQLAMYPLKSAVVSSPAI